MEPSDEQLAQMAEVVTDSLREALPQRPYHWAVRAVEEMSTAGLIAEYIACTGDKEFKELRSE